MKFGKSVIKQIEESHPEWRDKLLSYKDLKKRLKLIQPKAGENRDAKRPKLASAGEEEMTKEEETDFSSPAAAAEEEEMTKEQTDFMELMESELEKLNTFFVEKEEDYIIRFKDLQDRHAKTKDMSEEMIKIQKEIVDFHGEMVLLEQYCAINYRGLVKILKKYDKRTGGALLRSPFMQKVFQQPFFTTDLLFKLVKDCEAFLDRHFPIIETPTSTEAADGDKPLTSTTAKDDGLLRGP